MLRQIRSAFVLAPLASVLCLATGCADILADSPKTARSVAAPTPAATPAPSAAVQPAVAAHDPTVSRARCSSVRKPSEPDTFTLDPSTRAKLTRLRAIGAVAVRYEGEGCDAELHVLPSCVAPAQKYAFTAYPATARKIARDDAELAATMPLGAATLSGWVNGTRGVRTDYVLSGQYALPPDAVPRPQDLLGPDCARATHVVAAVYVGAFATVAGDTNILEHRATVLDLGSTAPELQLLAAEGSPDACKASQADGKPDPRCSVPLRVALVPLESAPPTTLAAGCPTGTVRRGERCVVQEIVTEVDCPAGTKWSGDRCTPRVDTTCTAGLHFESGRGCVPDVAKTAHKAPPVQAVPVLAPPPAAQETGYFSIDTYPYTKVSLDGRLLGVTPLVHAAIPPGTHTITLENTSEGVLRTTVVTVKPGETVTRRLAF